MAWELEGSIGPAVWSLSPHAIYIRTFDLRRRQRHEMLRMASAASVPHMKKSDHQKWWKEHNW